MTKMTRSMRSMMSMRLGTMFIAMTPVQSAPPASTMIDLSGQGSLQITLGLVEASDRVAAGDAAVVSFGGRVAQGAMLHGFRVDVVDVAGRPVQGSTTWDMTVFAGAQGVGATRLRALVRLSGSSREISLPKPLGFRLDASDSLLIVVTFHETDSQLQLFLRLTVDYDPLNGPHSRLAVLPLGVTTWDSATTVAAAQSWEWKAELSGRLLAIAGLPLDGVSELVLQDAETGALLWSAVLPAQQAVHTRPGQVVRFGVPVQEGRGYRLTATYRASHLRVGSAHGATAVAMVLPSRS